MDASPTAHRALSAASIALSIAALAACGRVNTVELTVAAGRRGPTSLLCREAAGNVVGADAGTHLISRARADGMANVVVDFFALEGGFPSCLPTQFAAFCEDHCCRHLASRRACIPVSVPQGTPLSAEELARTVARSVDGRAVTADAPDGPLFVRAVATSQPCNELAPTPQGTVPRFDPARLLGCAYSCPVVLDTISGELVLDLPVPPALEECGPAVRQCAFYWETMAERTCPSP